MLALTLMLILGVNGAIKTRVFLPYVNDMNCILYRSGELGFTIYLQLWQKLTQVNQNREALRRLCFYRCLSVHRGGRAWQGACVAGGACVADTTRYGRYASYWNAFLLYMIRAHFLHCVRACVWPDGREADSSLNLTSFHKSRHISWPSITNSLHRHVKVYMFCIFQALSPDRILLYGE